MRLRRLDLTRYGMFRDCRIDFGDRAEGAPDLHVVYGPNESGKTTAAIGFVDLLFGIQIRTPYDFLHGNSMRVAAVLSFGDEQQAVSRRKGRKDTLLDSRDEPVGDGFLSKSLFGMDRDTWRTMFSLSEETLSSGAEDILAAKGDLGQLLFQGVAGLVDLDDRLRRLGGQANEFYEPRKRKTRLNAIKTAIKELEGRLKETDINAREFADRKESLQTAIDAEAKARSEYQRLRRREAELRKTRTAFPMRDGIEDLRRKLSGLPDYGEFPAEFHGNAKQLASALQDGGAALAGARERIERFEKERSEIEISQPLLELAAALADLRTAAASCEAAEADLPRRREELRTQEFDLRQLMRRLGADDSGAIEDYKLSVPEIEKINHFSVEAQRLEQERSKAEEERLRAEKQLQAVIAKAVPDRTGSQAGPELQAIAREIRSAALEAELRSAERALAAAEAQQEAALRALRPWAGDPGSLTFKAFPSRALAEKWRDIDARNAEERRATQHELQTARGEAAELRASVARMTESEGLISDEAAAASRGKRDAAWERHYDALDRATADEFKLAMDENDRIQAERAAKTDRIAELREAERTLALRHARMEELDSRIEDADANKLQLRDEMEPRLLEAGLPREFDAAELPDWLDRRRTAIEAARECDERTRALDDIRKSIDRQRSRIRDALRRTQVAAREDEASLSVLAEFAEDRLKSEDAARIKAEENAKQRQLAKEQLDGRTESLSDAELKLEHLKRDWARERPADWLADTPLNEMAALLPDVRALREAADQHESLRNRIQGMERAVSGFAERMGEIASRLGEDPPGNPVGYFRDVQERMAEAEKSCAEAERLERELSRERAAEEQAALMVEEANSQLGSIAAALGVDFGHVGADGLVEALEDSKKRADLEDQVAGRGRELAEQLGAPSVGEALEVLAARNIETVDADLVECETEVGNALKELTQAVENRSSAERGLDDVGGDDRVVRIKQDIQTAYADIEEGAEKAIRSRLGLLAAERALRQYRDEHRNTLLKRTEEHFKTMTGGAYQELSSESIGGAEQLTAFRPSDERSCQVEHLSKGTRLQLYLALRMAGYQHFTESNGPLPFVADDIMESFDDNRSRSAFSLMSEISKQGQMIYFTHHEHVLDLARDACGDSAKIHTMPAGTD